MMEYELSCVWDAMRKLPTKEQQIMLMKYFMEMSDNEIAEKVGLAASSIRKYISRARGRIKLIVT